MGGDLENYYQILGVAHDASNEEIRGRYRFLAKAYHPDRFTDPETKTQAEDEMKRLNEAYSVLSNPEKRRAYDAGNGNGVESDRNKANRRSEDQYFYKRADEINDYLKRVEKKWRPIIIPFPKSVELDESKKLFFQGVIVLIDKIFTPSAYEQIKLLINQFESRLDDMLAKNICLGAEFYKAGFPEKFNSIDLEIISSIPIQQLIFALLEEARRRVIISESESQEFIEGFAAVLFVLCEQSQAIGRDIVSDKRQPASAGTKKESQPLVSGNRVAANNIGIGYCQSCGRIRPIAKVTFHQVIGLIVVWSHRRVEGALCTDCIEKYFWEMTGKSLLFGWWGIISFIATPIFILINFAEYLSAWSIRKSSNNLSQIAPGWKLTAVGCVITITFLLINYFNQMNKVQTTTYQPTTAPFPQELVYTQEQPLMVTRIVDLYPTTPIQPTNTKPACLHWGEVNALAKGEYLCVYGTVNKAFWGDNIFYMTFSDDPNAFRLIVLGGYYFKDVQNNCVMIQGQVKTYGSMPYMEVGDNLRKCE